MEEKKPFLFDNFESILANVIEFEEAVLSVSYETTKKEIEDINEEEIAEKKKLKKKRNLS